MPFAQPASVHSTTGAPGVLAGPFSGDSLTLACAHLFYKAGNGREKFNLSKKDLRDRRGTGNASFQS
jgi:hypothetical protein